MATPLCSVGDAIHQDRQIRAKHSSSEKGSSMLTVRHNPSNFEEAIAGAFAGVEQGVSPESNMLPSMCTPTAATPATPAAASTTPEDVALATAAVNASTAALNFAAATRK